MDNYGSKFKCEHSRSELELNYTFNVTAELHMQKAEKILNIQLKAICGGLVLIVHTLGIKMIMKLLRKGSGTNYQIIMRKLS